MLPSYVSVLQAAIQAADALAAAWRGMATRVVNGKRRRAERRGIRPPIANVYGLPHGIAARRQTVINTVRRIVIVKNSHVIHSEPSALPLTHDARGALFLLLRVDDAATPRVRCRDITLLMLMPPLLRYVTRAAMTAAEAIDGGAMLRGDADKI